LSFTKHSKKGKRKEGKNDRKGRKERNSCALSNLLSSSIIMDQMEDSMYDCGDDTMYTTTTKTETTTTTTMKRSDQRHTLNIAVFGDGMYHLFCFFCVYFYFPFFLVSLLVLI
jgi:hypothetical protein